MSAATVEHYFGGCPECGNNDGYMNVVCDPEGGAPVNVCVCDAHRAAWVIGINMFSLDDSDTLEAMIANGEKLKAYREVKPLPMGSRLPRPGAAMRLLQGGRT